MTKTRRVYKLTDESGRTHNDTQWGPGVRHEATGIGPLCSAGWIHCYTDPLLAVLLNPIHANFSTPRLWEAQAKAPYLEDRGLKLGARALTTVRELHVPTITTDQRVTFAILCAQVVVGDRLPLWSAWAEEWLAGRDRSPAAAARAAEAAARAAAASPWAAWAASPWAAEAAARAAEAAARAAEAAARAAEAAAWAARAAEAAAWAAEAAARAAEINLIALAHQACGALDD